MPLSEQYANLLRMRMRRLAPVIVLVVLLAVGCSSEPRGFRAADASVPAKPNFVFILTNDLSNDLLMRHRADYPNIARLANRGTTFENSFVTTLKAPVAPRRRVATAGKGRAANRRAVLFCLRLPTLLPVLTVGSARCMVNP